LCAINVARNNKKVIYIDTEGSFSLDRLRQIALDYKKILGRMIFLRPTSFQEQKKDFEKLKDIINDKIGLIIVDTIGMLYRIELGTSKDIYEVNRELGKQISYLSEICRKKQIPVLLTNQVYSDFKNKGQIKIVGGDLLKYGSKCLIELQITNQNNRRAILKKHRSIPQEKQILFKIVETGVLGTKEGKVFKLF
jgi:DNA repair protein RadB